MFKRYWTTSSKIDNYFTLNSEHNWEDLSIHVRKTTNIHFLITIIEQVEKW